MCFRPRGDVGPSVPANVPGLDDLLEKERQLLKAKEEAALQGKPEIAKDDASKKVDDSVTAC